ncbi:hypothetical protein BCR33DRAFT_769825 [Rhizoclosmatium globosum]|uniref:Uncharacterized protein n=1 Tax=Rhizoclosmatium globosum TaxID=329046 RepID=A0A1Y2BRX0_9FUNG|nr:hypothetical protein BCR33DRAFT_769825 [Rhizoclosmatium globosum]|eukprot:ORY37474.1 hypothetical protein BCR33DRAFT_769825 [Rhizoclosmatium globosum]
MFRQLSFSRFTLTRTQTTAGDCTALAFTLKAPLVQVQGVRRSSSEAAPIQPQRKGRRPRSLRDTAPDPFEQERNLLNDQLARMQQSREAKLSKDSHSKPSSDFDSESNEFSDQKRNRPRNRINTSKLHLLSGHEKIELFKQLLAGGPPHVPDAAALYSLICKNGILDRLKYQDFHNFFRLLCSQRDADRYPLLVQRVWRDWGRDSTKIGIYSVASYAAYTKIIANWGDRVLARSLIADMQRDGIMGPDAIPSSSGGLKIDTYNQLLHLFTNPVLQLDISHLIESSRKANESSTLTSDEMHLQPPYILPNTQLTRTPSKPTTDDLLFARDTLLPFLTSSTLPWTTATHMHVLSLHSLLPNNLPALIEAHSNSLTHIESLAIEGPVQQAHASLKLSAHSISCFAAAGYTAHAHAVIKTLPNAILRHVEALFLGNDNVDVVSQQHGDMIRKDAARLLVVCLKTLSGARQAVDGSSTPKTMDVATVKIAETLVESLNGVIGCKMDENAVSYMVRVVAGANDLEKVHEWGGKGLLWFDGASKAGIRVRTVLVQVYGNWKCADENQWKVVRSRVLEIVDGVVEDSVAGENGERVSGPIGSKMFCDSVLDALDMLEVVGAEKGWVDLKDSTSKEVDDKEKTLISNY